MKIAICISGHLRNWKLNNTTNEFINHLKSYGEVDVFVSTWDRENAFKSWSQMHGLSNLSRCNNIIQKEDIEEFYKTKSISVFNDDFYSSRFSPLRVESLTSKKFNWHPNGVNENNVVHSIKMFFLINQVNLLKLEQEFAQEQNYDLVFRVRPDFEFFEEKYKTFDFSKIENDVLYIRKPHGSNICDQFAFGSSKIMDKYANTLYKVSALYDNDVFGDPEQFLFYQIAMNEIKVYYLNTKNELFGFGCLGSEIVKDFKR